ncbi:unnamed protein product [Paramecium octaurelia]|uniref:Uncharacterized protein n=1 Tax=Paramecium octaurelia TaxID=43137 RepID=A0A8S1S685_PAROT|nr:unnamed protein product [Paramecium octaurelia]
MLFEYKTASGQVSIRPFLQRVTSIQQAIGALQTYQIKKTKINE